MVEECRNCIPCQAATHGGTANEEMRPTELPANSWEYLCMDFTGPLICVHPYVICFAELVT